MKLNLSHKKLWILSGIVVILLLGVMAFQSVWLGAWQSYHFKGEFATIDDKVSAMNQQKLYAGSSYLLRQEYNKNSQFSTGLSLYRNLKAMGEPSAAVNFGEELIEANPVQHDFRIQLAYDLADLGRVKAATQLLDQGINTYHLDIFVVAQTEVNKHLQR